MQVTFTVEIEGLEAAIEAAMRASDRPQTVIAAEAGMSVGNLNRIKSGQTKALPFETLKRLDQALGSSLCELAKEAIAAQLQ